MQLGRTASGPRKLLRQLVGGVWKLVRDCCCGCVPCAGVTQPARYGVVGGITVFSVSRAGCGDTSFDLIDGTSIPWDGTFPHDASFDCAWSSPDTFDEFARRYYVGDGPDGPADFGGGDVFPADCPGAGAGVRCWYLEIRTAGGAAILWRGVHVTSCKALPDGAEFTKIAGCATGPATLSVVTV